MNRKVKLLPLMMLSIIVAASCADRHTQPAGPTLAEELAEEIKEMVFDAAENRNEDPYIKMRGGSGTKREHTLKGASDVERFVKWVNGLELVKFDPLSDFIGKTTFVFESGYVGTNRIWLIAYNQNGLIMCESGWYIIENHKEPYWLEYFHED
jgi:hypothetical protein